MLSQSYRDILGRTAMGALTPAHCQILVESVRPGSWNQIVPINNAPYAVVMARIIDAADGQGWLRDLVQRLVDDYPTRPEFATVLAEIDKGAPDAAGITVSQEVLADLTEAEDAETETIRTPVREPMLSRIWIAWITAAVIAVLSVLGGLWWTSRLPPSVAMVAIEKQAGAADGAWVGMAISELMASDLAAGSTPPVTPQEDVLRMKEDLQLPASTNLSRETLHRIRKRLSVRWVIVGSYQYKTRDDPNSSVVRLRLRMFDTANGSELAATTRTGSDAQLGKLVSIAVSDLRERAGLQDLSIAQTIQAAAAVPISMNALRSYSEALTKLRHHDAAGARDLLRTAAAAETHPLIHSALAEAYAALGERPKAAAEAQKVLALSGKLSDEQKWQLAARVYELAQPPDWQKAVGFRTLLWTRSSRKLEHGLRLADAQISQGKVEAALLTIAELRKLARRDPRVDLVEARAYQQESEFDRQKKLAQKAADHAEAIDATSLVAEARLIEATAHHKLGDPKAMSNAIEDAFIKFRVAGDDSGAARALEQEATRLDQILEYELERDYLGRALKIHQDRNDYFAIARVLLNKGTTYYSQGATDKALPLYKQALATFETIDAPYPHAVTLNQVGALMFNRGDLRAAQASYEKSLALFDRSSDPSGRAAAITNIGEIYECWGNLTASLQMHEESLRTNQALKDPGAIAYDHLRIGEIFRSRGEFATARAQYNDARNLYNAEKDELGIADSDVALASLDIDEGKPAVAEQPLENARRTFEKGKVTDSLARTLAVTAESLLAQGKQKEALALASRALSLAPRENLRIRLPIETTLARARAASGKQEDRDAALQSLDKTIAEAREGRFVLCELDARLAAAEIEAKVDRDKAEQKLAALAVEAKEKGLGRIELRASRI